jgi:hypothetical protein
MNSKTNTKDLNTEKKRKRVDPRMTVQYYSIYQSWVDVVVMAFICFIAIVTSALVLWLICMSISSPHEELNLLFIIFKLLTTIATWILKIIRAICIGLFA